MARKTALVTGAGSGLGMSIANALAREGYDVAIHTGSNLERALINAEKIRKETGCAAEVIESDFSKPRGAEKAFELFRQKFDRLDLFVNNAGITVGAAILDATEELFEAANNINWVNAYFCAQKAARLMIENQVKGNIVLISSNHHLLIGNGNSIYSITKESLVKFAKHAALEFARYGIRVNCIAPGWVKTGEKRLESYYEDSLKEIPLHRWVLPEEIAGWILFFTGPHAASLTGATIDLDGGVRLMSGRPEYYC
ncbi:MAG: SDR family oxidoreductase [Clostridiales bacterium]|nr:SDR family oxidoreductase [Clostridiales bacterium]